MQTYYCYEIGADCRIVARHDIEAVDDADAVAAAWVFSAQGKNRSFELWIGSRLVFNSELGTAAFSDAGGDWLMTEAD